MTNLFEGLISYMPQPQNHNTKRYIVTVRLHPFWRHALRYYPYVVGERVAFKIVVKDISSEQYPYSLHIWEGFGGKELDLYENIQLDNGVFEGSPISYEGDILYKLSILGPRGALHERTALTILTAKAKNTDRWAWGCFTFGFGIIGTVVAQIIINLIRTEPGWQVWIPEWILKWLR